MNYILIEEKAWTELLAAAKRLKEKVETLEHHFNPIERYCSQKCVWRRINKKVYRFFRFV